MWNRGELKAQGKGAFLANYWRCVLVALILTILAGTSGGSSGGSAGQNISDQSQNVGIQEVDQIRAEFDRIVEQFGMKQVMGAIAVILGFLAAIAIVITIIKILVLNPLEVGCYSFFLKNCREKAYLSELGSAFRNNWKGSVLTMFLKNLFLTLWFCLLIVPGLIKLYSYRMVPYLLIDHPECGPQELITMSRKMMDGQKWNAFVLDLSFIGWYLLSAITFGLVGIFFVFPYKESTDAQLYEALKGQFPSQEQQSF